MTDTTYGRLDWSVAGSLVGLATVALDVFLTVIADDAFTGLHHALVGSLVVERQTVVNTAMSCAAPETLNRANRYQQVVPSFQSSTYSKPPLMASVSKSRVRL